jgi:hypothetical protein
VLNIGSRRFNHNLVHVLFLPFALHQESRRPRSCPLVWPHPHIDVVIISAWTNLNVESSSCKELCRKALKLPPIDPVNRREVSIQIDNEPLIDELTVLRRQTLAIE